MMAKENSKELALHLGVGGFAFFATGMISLSEWAQSCFHLSNPWFSVGQAILIVGYGLFYMALAIPFVKSSESRVRQRTGFFVEMGIAYVLAGLVGILAGSRFHGVALLGVAGGLLVTGLGMVCLALILGQPLIRAYAFGRVKSYLERRLEILKAVLFVEEIRATVKRLRKRSR